MTTVYDCLGFRFSVGPMEPTFDALLADLYAPFVSDSDADVYFTVVEWTDPVRFAIFANERPVRVLNDARTALAHVIWEVNQRAIEIGGPGRVLLHAAAAEMDGRAVLVSGPSGAGKSTLVAGLVVAGLGYLTDDVAVFDPGTGLVLPYPKPLGVDQGLRSLVLGADRAGTDPAVARYLGREGFFRVGELGTIGAASRPELVVVPVFSPDRAGRLVEMTSDQARALLTSQVFPAGPAADREAVLEDLVRSAVAVELHYGDLATGVRVVRDLLGA